jgi:hypothetical protein
MPNNKCPAIDPGAADDSGNRLRVYEADQNGYEEERVIGLPMSNILSSLETGISIM